MQWDRSETFKIDQSTFLFSFNHNQKYTPRNNKDVMRCYPNDGPSFGGCAPEIYLTGTLNKGHSFEFHENTFFIERKLTNGEEFWDVKELEVHKIIYI